MAYYYVDSSVLVKRHVQESGTPWVQSLMAAVIHHFFFAALCTQEYRTFAVSPLVIAQACTLLEQYPLRA